jgi:RNA polymerase sigma-70 factor (ECF subfamily)
MKQWGDEEFSTVFNEVYPDLCRYLECLIGRTGSAQEIAQESLLRLHRAGPDRIARGEERFWVFRVATNLARNELRRRRVRENTVDRIAGLFGRKAPDPFEAARRSEFERRVLAALARLPERQRATLLLREQDEMSYDEIGRLLDVPTSTVRVDLFRARSSLRAELAGLGDAPDRDVTARRQNRSRRGLHP